LIKGWFKMSESTQTPTYIKNLLKPTATKATSRKVWSIDLETTWLPFFTASNAMNDTAIPHEALGAPLRLAYAQDGSVKFSKSGKPVIKVAKDISDNVKMVRENFIAGLQTYANTVFNEHGKAYKAQIAKSIEAGKPIQQHDKEKLDEAMEKLVQQAIDEAENKESPTTPDTRVPTQERELVPA
jgi:gas vesicle protein